MTTVQPHSLVSDSIRPANSNEAAPVYGVGSERIEVAVEDEKAVDDAIETPADGDEEDKEKVEEEIDEDERRSGSRESVGGRCCLRRPTLPSTCRCICTTGPGVLTAGPGERG